MTSFMNLARTVEHVRRTPVYSQVEAAGATDRGRVRTRNEDAFCVDPTLGLFMVADGLGGRDMGHAASAMAVSTVQHLVADVLDRELHDRPLASWTLSAALRHANACVHSAARKQAKGRGMATTFAGILVEGDDVCIAHVGDSRVYRLRHDELELLTADHSLLNELLAQGVAPEWAQALPQRGALTRALGLEAEVDVTLQFETAKPDDVLLLCTDGLSNAVEMEDIAYILSQNADAEAAAAALIAEANDLGGPDNITVVVVRWNQGASSDSGIRRTPHVPRGSRS
jgi:PPM family protein phosphatase